MADISLYQESLFFFWNCGSIKILNPPFHDKCQHLFIIWRDTKLTVYMRHVTESSQQRLCSIALLISSITPPPAVTPSAPGAQTYQMS